MLKEVPLFEQPREKAIKYGVAALSNIELLAILLRTGTKEENVLELSKKVLYSFQSITKFKDMSPQELLHIKGIGPTKAIGLLASIEFGKRIMQVDKEFQIYTTPEQVSEHFHPKMSMLTIECLYALYLNTKGVLIQEQLITQGTINASLIDGRDVFKWAVKFSASAIILVHNHPSGDPTPSIADLKATEKLLKLSGVMGIQILDHIIIGHTFYSMKRNSKIFKLF